MDACLSIPTSSLLSRPLPRCWPPLGSLGLSDCRDHSWGVSCPSAPLGLSDFLFVSSLLASDPQGSCWVFCPVAHGGGHLPLGGTSAVTGLGLRRFTQRARVQAQMNRLSRRAGVTLEVWVPVLELCTDSRWRAGRARRDGHPHRLGVGRVLALPRAPTDPD